MQVFQDYSTAVGPLSPALPLTSPDPGRRAAPPAGVHVLDDPAGDYGPDLDTDALAAAPDWHRRLDGGRHCTPDALARAEAETIMLTRLGRRGSI